MAGLWSDEDPIIEASEIQEPSRYEAEHCAHCDLLLDDTRLFRMNHYYHSECLEFLEKLGVTGEL